MSLLQVDVTKRDPTKICLSTLCRAFGGPIIMLSLLTDQHTQFPLHNSVHYHKIKPISRARSRLSHASNTYRKLSRAQKHNQSDKRSWSNNIMAAILTLAIKRTSVVRDEVASNPLAIKLLTGHLEVASPENAFVRGCFVNCLACLVFSKQYNAKNYPEIHCPSVDLFAMNACAGDRQFIPIMIDSISCWSAKYILNTIPYALDHNNKSESDR